MFNTQSRQITVQCVVNQRQDYDGGQKVRWCLCALKRNNAAKADADSPTDVNTLHLTNLDAFSFDKFLNRVVTQMLLQRAAVTKQQRWGAHTGQRSIQL